MPSPVCPDIHHQFDLVLRGVAKGSSKTVNKLDIKFKDKTRKLPDVDPDLVKNMEKYGGCFVAGTGIVVTAENTQHATALVLGALGIAGTFVLSLKPKSDRKKKKKQHDHLPGPDDDHDFSDHLFDDWDRVVDASGTVQFLHSSTRGPVNRIAALLDEPEQTEMHQDLWNPQDDAPRQPFQQGETGTMTLEQPSVATALQPQAVPVRSKYSAELESE